MHEKITIKAINIKGAPKDAIESIQLQKTPKGQKSIKIPERGNQLEKQENQSMRSYFSSIN